MIRFNGIVAKTLVWLAAILVPAETMPSVFCCCGQDSSRAVSRKSVPKCPHCKPVASCCAAKASRPGGCCCAGKASCCKHCLGSRSEVCQCSVKAPEQAPSPATNGSTANSRTATDLAVAAFISVPSAHSDLFSAHAAATPSLLGANGVELLHAICRLTI